VGILFLLGLSSGLPYILILSTLSMWLIEAGLSKGLIGSFVLVSLPYSGKFLWASFVDHSALPILTRYLGQRRSWALFSQVGVGASLWWLGHTDPVLMPWATAVAATTVSFFAATQDIAVEAYRTEVLDERILGAGAGLNGFGYRLGMLVGGAGALYISAIMPWSRVYEMMALCMVCGVGAIFLAPEKKPQSVSFRKKPLPKHFHRARVQEFIAITFAFLRQPLAWVVLVFIFFFKFISTVMIVMTPVFLTDLGFGKIEIANIAKLFGIVAMMVGGLTAGVCISVLGMHKSLWICLIMKSLAAVCFVLQATMGKGPTLVIFTMGLEHIASGMGTTVLVAYLSGLCRAGYSGMDFALLSSYGSFCRVVSSVVGGWLAYALPWSSFFVVLTLLVVPCFLLLGSYSHVFVYWHRKPSLRPL
jgi:PAT family beta-lactamase induction signal transducer AmpG